MGEASSHSLFVDENGGPTHSLLLLENVGFDQLKQLKNSEWHPPHLLAKIIPNPKGLLLLEPMAKKNMKRGSISHKRIHNESVLDN